jgi:hypothetical protein
MGVGALLSDKFDSTSLFNFIHVEIIDRQNTENYLMLAKISRLSLMT